MLLSKIYAIMQIHIFSSQAILKLLVEIMPQDFALKTLHLLDLVYIEMIPI